jgi:hypothetical protein
MELNEKIALLAKVGIIKTGGTEDEINTEIVNYFATVDPDSHDFLLKNDSSSEEIMEAAIGFIQKNAGDNSGAENIRLSAGAYDSATNAGAPNPGTSVTNAGTAITPVSGTAKNTSKVKDITTQLAGSLPSTAKNEISGMLDVNWPEIMSRANGTAVAAYCIDTPVREYLTDKTFSITSEEYKKAFKEKYLLSNVFDDSEYSTPTDGGTPQLIKEGANIAKFKEILGKIESGAPFNVRVPEVQNQKVIGVLLMQSKGTSQDEKPLAMKDVPIYVLTDCGGKIPGQPGIIVTGISSRTSQKNKNGTVDTQEKQSIAIKHKGKAVAIKSDPTKFLRVTSQPVEDEAAKKEFGSATKEYSVSSVDSFVYLDKDRKKHTVRVRGKITVPYFRRMDDYIAAFGPIAAANRVEALTDADKKNVAMLFSAAANSDHLRHEFASAIGLENLVSNIEQNNQTPAFNAATANIAS